LWFAAAGAPCSQFSHLFSIETEGRPSVIVMQLIIQQNTSWTCLSACVLPAYCVMLEFSYNY